MAHDSAPSLEMAVAKQKTELLVGVFLFFGLLLLTALVFQFGRFSGKTAESYPLFLIVRDAAGLKVGAPVRLGGVRIGEVGAEPVLSEDFSRLSVELRIETGKRIPKGSRLSLSTSGLLGDSYVRIEPPEHRATGFYTEGDQLTAGSGVQTLDDLATDAVATLDKASDVLAEVGASIEAINGIFDRFDQEVLDPENLGNVRSILADLQKSSERIELATRRIDPLLGEVEATTVEARGAATTAKETFTYIQGEVGEISENLSTAEPVISELDGSLDDLRETLRSLDSLIDSVEHGGGLTSALIRDSGLRRDLESFLDKLERNGILRYPREGSAALQGVGRSGDRTSGNRSSSAPSRSSGRNEESTREEKKKLFPLFRP